MQSERESLERLCNSSSEVSSHYFINEKGKIFQLVQEQYIAWHAGKSCWKKFRNLNKNSIGIELVNKGHEFGYTTYNKEQIDAFVSLCKKIIKKHKIKKYNIIGHSDVAPLRKDDPGEKFPWKYLSQKKIGIWHNCNNNLLKRNRNLKVKNKNEKEIFIKSLSKIGYCTKSRKAQILFKTIKSFQRHFRKELINGLLDQECLISAKNLNKMLKNA